MRFDLSTVTAVAMSLTGIGSCAPVVEKPTLKFPYGSTKVRGVNLGGWLVLEPWITPSLFAPLYGAAIDEWTFCATLGATEAHKRLHHHWNTWITPGDFQSMAAAGLNHVRIPIGYWSVIPNPGEPFVQGAYAFLGQALEWAQTQDIMVLIDLHGAPGSQNGFDSSGRYGPIDWTQGDTVRQTMKVLNKIREDYAAHPAVAAIELVNEPLGPSLNMDTVRQFYRDGWENLQFSNVAITFHDAFEGATSWNSWGSGMGNLILDTHHYEIFDQSSLSMSAAEHVRAACGFGDLMASNNKWTIAGEWTGAMTDCAQWLNGYNKGARYNGSLAGSTYIGSCAGLSTGSVTQLSKQQQNDMTMFIEAQLDAFEMAAGWFFWTWKTEGAPGWDMQDMLENGVFPWPVWHRRYPGQCSIP